MLPFPRSIARTLGLASAGLSLSFGLASGCSSAGGASSNDAPGTGGAGGAAAQGDETGPCYPNKTCNGNLKCLSDVCVDAGGTGGAGGKGGAAGGSAGSTPSAGASGKGGASGSGGSGQAGKGGGAGAGQAGTGGKGGTSGASGTAGASGQGGTSTAGGASGSAGASGASQGGAGASAGASGAAGAATGGTSGVSGAAGAAGAAGSAGSGAACAGDVYTAQPDPAALLFVLDRSASMAGSKWQALAAAVVQAMAQPEFDSMSVGMLAAPSGSTASPACISFILPTVPCLAPPAPQIAIADVGPKPSSDPTGLRGQIKTWVDGNAPQPPSLFDPDASPLYAAINNGLGALAAWPNVGKRILVIVSDGSIDCNQNSNRPGFPDGNGCSKEWEDPNNIVGLVQAANADATKPVQTFVVGVPGADTYDPSGANYPPYHMRLALSAIAAAGAPTFVDPACNGTTFTPGGADPSVPCHFDMTQGAFDAQTLADNLAKIRSKTLGCTFNLPTPASGTLDPAQVNVRVDVGSGLVDVPRRKDMTDQCLADPCWDYDANGKVELIGQECSLVTASAKPTVVILAGCKTNYKP